jgi:hypothetical protein
MITDQLRRLNVFRDLIPHGNYTSQDQKALKDRVESVEAIHIEQKQFTNILGDIHPASGYRSIASRRAYAFLPLDISLRQK